MIALLCVWACLLATYLLFAGSVSADEVVAGALCAASAVLWWVATRRTSAHTFAFGPGCWAAAWRALRGLPGATLSVATMVLRTRAGGQVGEVTSCFFDNGRRTDPSDGGRRAIGVLAASLAPDSFVLRTPVERDEIIIHAVVAREPPKDPRWPI